MTPERYPLGPVGPHLLYRVKTRGEDVVIAREAKGNHIFPVFQGLEVVEPVELSASESLGGLYEGLVIDQGKEYETHDHARGAAEQLRNHLADAKRQLGNRALILIASRPHDYVSASVLKSVESVDTCTVPIVGRYDDGPVGTLPRAMRIHALGVAPSDNLQSDLIWDNRLGPLDAMDYDFRGKYSLPAGWITQRVEK